MNANFVQLKRVLPANIRRVFEAWSSGSMMSRWFVVDATWTAKASADFRTGGQYRVEMLSGDRTVGVAFGEYMEITPPHRLMFSWNSEGPAGVQNSVVTIDLEERGENTELTLTHDLDPETKEGRAHGRGWEGCLANLEAELK